MYYVPRYLLLYLSVSNRTQSFDAATNEGRSAEVAYGYAQVGSSLLRLNYSYLMVEVVRHVIRAI